MVAESGRDELAQLIDDSVDETLDLDGAYDVNAVADAILSSSWLAGQLKQARAEGWDVGYSRGLLDEMRNLTHEADNPFVD